MIIDTTVKPVVRWGVQHALPRQAVRMGARKGDLQTRLILDSGTHSTEQLSTLMREIRDRGPLANSGFARLAATHEECREVLSSSDFRVGFPIDTGPVGKVAQWSESEPFHPIKAPSLLAVDGPDHTRYRKMVTRAFTARAVEALRDRVQDRAEVLLDRIAAHPGDEFDLVETYCAQLPVMVIAEILGVPEREHQHVLRMGAGAAASLDMGLGWSRFRSVERSLIEFDTWIEEHLLHLQRSPGDDLMSKLAAAEDEEGGMSMRELKSTAGLVLAAGFETTVNLLGNAIALLQRHPEQVELLRANPDVWAGAVEETLRFDPPVLLTGRTATRDTQIAGAKVREGTMVTAILAAANRDPAVFADPDTYDVTRDNAREHLAFGGGRHYCLGAALARLEGEVGLRSLYERFDRVQLRPGAQRRDTRILRGFETLPAQVA